MLLQGNDSNVQLGYHRGFERLIGLGVLDDYFAIPYRTLGPPPSDFWATIYSKALNKIRIDGFDILFFQHFHGGMPDPRPFVSEARKLNPNLLVLTSCGDGFGKILNPPPKSLCHASAVADLNFSTSMGHLASTLVRSGARNLVLMPWGVCQERFIKPSAQPRTIEFDVVFIGRNHGGRNPFAPLSHAGRHRRAMVLALERRYGKRFGLFGPGWEGYQHWQGPIPFDSQQQIMRNSRIQVGGFPGSYATYYTSDRPYIAMASGTPFLDCMVPGMDKLMAPNKHWIPYRDIPDMLIQVDRMLARPQEELDAMGAQARAFVLNGHTLAHRAEEMISIVRSLQIARNAGCVAEPPLLRCFHPEVDPIQEIPQAVRNWRG